MISSSGIPVLDLGQTADTACAGGCPRPSAALPQVRRCRFVGRGCLRIPAGRSGWHGLALTWRTGFQPVQAAQPPPSTKVRDALLSRRPSGSTAECAVRESGHTRTGARCRGARPRGTRAAGDYGGREARPGERSREATAATAAERSREAAAEASRQAQDRPGLRRPSVRLIRYEWPEASGYGESWYYGEAAAASVFTRQKGGGWGTDMGWLLVDVGWAGPGGCSHRQERQKRVKGGPGETNRRSFPPPACPLGMDMPSVTMTQASSA